MSASVSNVDTADTAATSGGQTDTYRPTHVLSSDDPPEPTDTPAEPGSEPPPADPPEQSSEPPAKEPPEKTAEERRADSERRRIEHLTRARYAEKARADAAEAARAELEERLRRLENPNAPPAGELQRQIEARAQELLAQQHVQRQVADFHTAGRAAYPDWQVRCENLQAMGADPQIAEMLIALPNGAAVAGALADNPADLQRIADLRSERARAIELGRYSAELANRAGASRAVSTGSRLPSPIRPPQAGRARGEPDPAGSMDDYNRWSKSIDWSSR